jgi:hypothetical protein
MRSCRRRQLRAMIAVALLDYSSSNSSWLALELSRRRRRQSPALSPAVYITCPTSTWLHTKPLRSPIPAAQARMILVGANEKQSEVVDCHKKEENTCQLSHPGPCLSVKGTYMHSSCKDHDTSLEHPEGTDEIVAPLLITITVQSPTPMPGRGLKVVELVDHSSPSGLCCTYVHMHICRM